MGIGASFWWPDALPGINQLWIREETLESTSVVVSTGVHEYGCWLICFFILFGLQHHLIFLTSIIWILLKNIFSFQWWTNSFLNWVPERMYTVYLYSIIRLYRTRLYRNSAYIEVQSAVPPDTMSIQKMIGYIETWIYRSIHHGPLNFDITGLYCNWNMLCLAHWLNI